MDVLYFIESIEREFYPILESMGKILFIYWYRWIGREKNRCSTYYHLIMEDKIIQNYFENYSLKTYFSEEGGMVFPFGYILWNLMIEMMSESKIPKAELLKLYVMYLVICNNNKIIIHSVKKKMLFQKQFTQGCFKKSFNNLKCRFLDVKIIHKPFED